MPTPSSNPPPDLPPRSHSSTCPDDLRTSWRPGQNELETDMNVDSDGTQSDQPVRGTPAHRSATMTDDVEVDESRSSTQSPRPDSRSEQSQEPPARSEDVDMTAQARKPMDLLDSASQATQAALQRVISRYDAPSPANADSEKADDALSSAGIQHDAYTPSIGYDFSNVRISPTSCSTFLRPGSKFKGTQQSERQVYQVEVEIKYVDLRESFLCGFLKIQGLTEDNPTLTTYFEGEIIGPKYGFFTKHPTWGATEKIDLSHWGKFSAFRQQQYHKTVRRGGTVSMGNLSHRDNIFMRWKERFLVPDHRVRTINGASFEGFYYICFNQKEGVVNGIYFHSKSEKFQQLELKHEEDKGCFGAVEFR